MNKCLPRRWINGTSISPWLVPTSGQGLERLLDNEDVERTIQRLEKRFEDMAREIGEEVREGVNFNMRRGLQTPLTGRTAASRVNLSASCAATTCECKVSDEPIHWLDAAIERHRRQRYVPGSKRKSKRSEAAHAKEMTWLERHYSSLLEEEKGRIRELFDTLPEKAAKPDDH